MERKRVYITVKTYPTLSTKYDELVCTAGICDDGSWIRLFPLPFRQMERDRQFKKWQWIEVDVERRVQKDTRPESYRVTDIDNLKVISSSKSGKVDWGERKQIIFKTEKVFTNKTEILGLTKTNPPSRTLLTFKPNNIVKFYTKPVERDWPKEKLDLIKEKAKQLSLFQTEEDIIKEFSVVQKLPYEFRYVFVDDEGIESDLMIEDWEVGALYLNCLKDVDENKALEKVRQQYWDNFMKKDIYFFLGTRYRDQARSPNPFSIVRIFYPPVDKQGKLFS
jgi:hypothetical protein